MFNTNDQQSQSVYFKKLAGRTWTLCLQSEKCLVNFLFWSFTFCESKFLSSASKIWVLCTIILTSIIAITSHDHHMVTTIVVAVITTITTTTTSILLLLLSSSLQTAHFVKKHTHFHAAICRSSRHTRECKVACSHQQSTTLPASIFMPITIHSKTGYGISSASNNQRNK